jgi:predicted enzyme related to lactoylglutathione lyase
MGQPVVHFEVIGRDPENLRRFYGELFDWDFQVGDAGSPVVSDPGQYGFIDGSTNGEAGAINGGVGGGPGLPPALLFYVGVPDVAAALKQAEKLGGKRLLGPEPKSGDFTVGHIADPEGNVVGVAGPTTE